MDIHIPLASAIPFFDIAIGFVCAMTVFETYIDFRQLLKTREDKLPSFLAALIKDEKSFHESRRYSQDKLLLTLAEKPVGFALQIALLWFLRDVWDFSAVVGTAVLQPLFPYSSTVEYNAQNIGFLYLFVIGNWLVSLPFSLYKQFVVEQRHGFNKMTLRQYVFDTVKSLLLFTLLGVPLLLVAIALIEWGGEYFYLYLWGFLTFIGVIAAPIYRHIISPCFNKFDPVEEGELKQAVEQLAGKVSFPLKKLCVKDESTRSAHSNAYFLGFWKSKTIVLYDTLVQQQTVAQITAVLAHEIGHWKHGHTWKNLVLGSVQNLLFFFLFKQFVFNQEIYRAFGFETSTPTFVGLILFSVFFSPFGLLTSFLFNVWSRHCEYQADAFSHSLGYDIADALVSIHESNKGNLNPDRWYSTLHYSHPTLLERVTAINKLKPKSQ